MNIKDELLELLENSYAPYSKFHVASIVVMRDGKYFKGVNVENVSYGASICAERAAILSAVAAGYKRGDFHKIYIMTSGKKVATSCFLCRQVMSEFFDLESEVILSNKQGEAKRYYISELCPYPFALEELL